jgi:hypothetical protein
MGIVIYVDIESLYHAFTHDSLWKMGQSMVKVPKNDHLILYLVGPLT